MTCPGWGVLLFSQESWTAYHVEALLYVTGPVGPLLESLLLVSCWPQQVLQASLESVWEGCAQNPSLVQQPELALVGHLRSVALVSLFCYWQISVFVSLIELQRSDH